MNYTENEVFDIVDANRTVDMIYFKIQKYIDENAVPLLDLTKDMALSGAAAANLQGSSHPIKNIVLVTSEETLYNIFLKVVDEIQCTELVKFKEKTLITNPLFIIEFWMLNFALNVTLASDIYVQTKLEIPENSIS
jgi:hypothetical protein